jgi:oligopeptidase A
VAYYAEKQRAALYDFDEEALRPYFPLERVVPAVRPGEPPLRHPRGRGAGRAGVGPAGALLQHVRDEDGAFLGGFYADWYPRENKRGGAWMDA